MRCSRVLRVMLLVSLSLIMASSLWARKNVEIPANFGKDDWSVTHWEDAVRYLKYIADNNTRQKLLSVPESLRQEAWDEFWKKHDPVSSTPANEFRDQYFARVKYANENYGTNLRDGWLNDMGEVYIRMGQPMRTEKFTMRASGRDLEVWEYWTNYDVQLVFLDRSGLGDFDLLNPAEMIDQVYIYGSR
ncbi:MAG TPA: GWxTD domain-containing protein [archaeon]|nr:GWxTD domain-containing protein [archaeon]